MKLSLTYLLLYIIRKTSFLLIPDASGNAVITSRTEVLAKQLKELTNWVRRYFQGEEKSGNFTFHKMLSSYICSLWLSDNIILKF